MEAGTPSGGDPYDERRRAERLRRQREANRRAREKDPERAREHSRRWRENNPERAREHSRRWRENNPERHRQLARESEARRRTKQVAAERKKERARERAAPPAEKERLKRFREAHPEKIREYKERWRAKNPEHARKVSREAGTRSRDKHADEIRERQRKAAAKNRATNSEAHKQYYAENKERLAAYAREAGRVRRRLLALGLPPKSVHKSYANEKRANAAAATEFFTQRRSPMQLKELKIREAPKLGERPAVAVLQARERAETARRSREFAEGPSRVSHAIKMRLGLEDLRKELTRDVQLDSRARELTGREPYDVGVEVRRRIAAMVPADTLDARLLAQHVRLPQWWKQHPPNEIKDVFDWARAHSSHSPDHDLVKTTMTQTILERRAQRNSAEIPAASAHRSASKEQARWWGVDVDHGPTRTPGEIAARRAKDNEASTIAHDVARGRDRGRGRDR